MRSGQWNRRPEPRCPERVVKTVRVTAQENIRVAVLEKNIDVSLLNAEITCELAIGVVSRDVDSREE